MTRVINKILVVLLCLFVCNPSHAYYFSAQNWTKWINKYCPIEKRGDAVKKVNALRKQDANFAMADVVQIFNICGIKTQSRQQDNLAILLDNQICKSKTYNVTNTNDCAGFCKRKAAEIGCSRNGRVVTNKAKKQCTCNDTKAVAAVCGKDKGKTGAKESCITVFSDGFNFQMLQAVGVAKEYARVNLNVDDLECSDNYHTVLNQDYIQCKSKKNGTFYEFEFDDVNESRDKDIQSSIKKAISTIHSGASFDYTANNYMGGYRQRCGGAVVETLAKFGYRELEAHGEHCWIQRNVDLKNENAYFGIKGDEFFNGIQLKAKMQIIAKLKAFIRTALQVKGERDGKTYTLKSFSCDYNARQIPGNTGTSDDVLTCYANGKKIQFKFDDMSELWKTYAKGGEQGMDCIIVGGTYNGRTCTNLDEKQCKALSTSTTSCKECEHAKWNAKKEVCELPTSSSATSLEKGVVIGTAVVGAVAGTVLVVLSGGTIVAVGASAIGGSMAVTGEVLIQSKVQPFLEELNQLRSPACDACDKCIQRFDYEYCNKTKKVCPCTDVKFSKQVKEKLKYALNKLAPMAGDFTAAESNALAEETARLAAVIDDKTFVDDYSAMQDKPIYSPDAWTPELALRALGNLLQFAAGLGAFNKLFAKSAGKWDKFAKVMADRLQSVKGLQATMNYVDNANNAYGIGNSLVSGNNASAADGVFRATAGDLVDDGLEIGIKSVKKSANVLKGFVK